MPTSEQAAADAAARLLAGSDEAQDDPVSSEEPVAAEAPQETEQDLDFDLFGVTAPPELEEELEAPEFELEPEAVEDEEDDEFEDFEDHPDPKLLAKLKRAEKERDFYKQLRVKKDAKDWQAEAEKFYPLSSPFLDQINAQSRRAFLKQAKAFHDTLKPYVDEKIVKPARAAVEAARQKALDEARVEAEKRWGPADIDAPAVPTDATVTRENVERARTKGDLADVIHAMMFPTNG